MKLFLLLASLAAAPCIRADSELNVNQRYTVESVELAPSRPYRLSQSVMQEMQRLVGEHLNVDALDRLSRRMTAELRARAVTFRVLRGKEPAHVRVAFDVEKRQTDFDVALSNLAFNSREGWSGTGRAIATRGANVFTATGLSNGDDLAERYSGVRLRYDRLSAGTGRIRLGLEFDNFQEQYDSATVHGLRAAAPGSSLGAGLYRSRTNFEPSATFVLAKPLTLTIGLSFESLQPGGSQGPAEAADSLTGALQFREHWEGAHAGAQDLEAGYRLRAANRSLGSDSVYTKHAISARYAWRHERQLVELAIMAGMIYGRAPLFERFVLGNNTTLRGWSKYDLDPLGGNRVVHASVTYGYHTMRVFYDTGSVWDAGSGKGPEEKNSAGVGVNTGLGVLGKNALLVAVAFPIRRGHAEPVFLAGMNF